MGTSLVYSASASGGGERIHAMYALTWQWPASATYTATVTGDDAGTATLTLDGLWTRIYLAQSTGDGSTRYVPAELLAFVQAALGSSWEVDLRTDGYVQITNAGTTAATITWGTAQTVANALGFTASSVSLDVSESLVAPYPPLHVLYSVSLDSTDWTPSPTDGAYAQTGDGEVYGWQGGTEIVTKTVTLGHHPRTWADRVALGSPLTPMWPDDTDYNRRRRFYSASTYSQPFSAQEFLGVSRGVPIAAVFSGFQTFGLGRLYEIVFQTPESIAQAKAIAPAIKDYRQRSMRRSFEVSLYSAEELG